MLSLIFTFLIIWGLGKLIVLCCRLTWGVVKAIFSYIIVPMIVIAVFVSGFTYIIAGVVIAAVIIGIIAYFKNRRDNNGNG